MDRLTLLSHEFDVILSKFSQITIKSHQIIMLNGGISIGSIVAVEGDPWYN